MKIPDHGNVSRKRHRAWKMVVLSLIKLSKIFPKKVSISLTENGILAIGPNTASWKMLDSQLIHIKTGNIRDLSTRWIYRNALFALNLDFLKTLCG